MIPPLRHILCIDDEQDILQVAKLSLEIVGRFKVSLCNDSREAVDLVRSVHPDLIMLDVMMPEMDGPTTLRTLREGKGGETIVTPVIFVTAKARPDEIKSFQELGAIGVISKPFDPMTLSEDVLKIWSDAHDLTP
jgi:two-component system OmpR family response regulator